MLYEFNQLAKTIYDMYSYRNFIALPYNESSIKNPKLFSNSILISKDIDLPFMNDTVVNPTILNNAIKDTKIKKYLKKNDTHYLVNANNEYYEISRDIYDNEIKNIDNIKFLIDPDIYNNEYILTDADKDLLLGYETTELVIGNDINNKDIKFICTLKVFPAIKKANSIAIYTTHQEDNVYRILIYSIGDTWSFYSIHYILNF